MSFKMIAAIAAMAMAAAACQQIPENMTVAQFCAQPDKANTDVCKINVEIDGQKRALASTDMSLARAREIADNALARANNAQSTADAALAAATDAKGRRLDVIDLPAPDTLTDAHGFVDWSYVNHLVINGAVIACAFGEPVADARAADILAAAYPGRRIIPVDARELFNRGGGVHCITQQQPKPLT